MLICYFGKQLMYLIDWCIYILMSQEYGSQYKHISGAVHKGFQKWIGTPPYGNRNKFADISVLLSRCYLEQFLESMTINELILYYVY